ncbi:MAG: hypothetical protein HC850_10975 [Rhodomicrobium sp.]|nr:hypothetical protein [Rhodomicrobium sp.]
MARARTIDADIEAPPEADRLDGWPHPRETAHVVGHEAAEKMFLAALDSGRLHHAWLMAGAKGIGKASFAYRAASLSSCAGERYAGCGPIAGRAGRQPRRASGRQSFPSRPFGDPARLG